MKAFLAARQSPLIALAAVVALAVWFLSGTPDRGPGEGAGASAAKPRDLVPSVRVRTLEPRRITRSVVFSGRTEPARAVTLRAEVEGRVVEIGTERGSAVAAGDAIVRLDVRDRQARLTEATAVVEQRENKTNKRPSADGQVPRMRAGAVAAKREIRGLGRCRDRRGLFQPGVHLADPGQG